MSPYAAEFLGTAILVLLGDGVVANVLLRDSKGFGGGWIVITFGWAMAVFAGVLCAMAASGAHINPAVTLALALNGSFAWEQVAGYVSAQLGGAFVGATVVWLCYHDHFASAATVKSDPVAIRAVFCTVPAIRNLPRNTLVEAVGTFVLVFCVLQTVGPEIALDGRTSTVGLGSLGALPVSLVVLGLGLSLGGPTGYAINPARDLGPRFAHSLLPIAGKGGSDWRYAWVPIVGPLAGAALAVSLHRAIA